MKKSIILSVISIVVALSGCRMVGSSRPTLVQGIVENRTASTIRDVSVYHLPTRIHVDLNSILAGRASAVSFSPQVMRADEAVLSWTDNEAKFVRRLQLPKEDSESETGMSILVYRIFVSGNATVELIPVETPREQ